MNLQLTSPAFENGSAIPQKYTCDGEDVSPALRWEGAPAGTQSYVLICDDPDAPMGIWDHWVLFNIPASAAGLPENSRALPLGTREGKNSWGKTGYGGPCPPDREHRYFFKLYALDTQLDLVDDVDKRTLEAALKGHILGTAELMGRYDRPR